MANKGGKPALSLSLDTRGFFHQSLQEALVERKVETHPIVEIYLVGVLEHYLFTQNLFQHEEANGRKSRETLAEMMLKAGSSTPRVRQDLLKKLGDSALYISGFFGDSLQRKVVDVDYYIHMGASAYGSLSRETYEDASTTLFREIAHRFNEFVDVFTVMSRKSMQTQPDNVFRLMDVFSKTGSSVAQEKLAEKGIFTSTQQLKSVKNQ